MGRKGKVAYLYDGQLYTYIQKSALAGAQLDVISPACSAGEVGGAYYGIKHPMKPHRMRMTNELIIEYGLADHLDVYVS